MNGDNEEGTNPKNFDAEYEAWFRREVEAGLAEANAGNLIPADEVETRFAAKRDATRRRLEASK